MGAYRLSIPLYPQQLHKLRRLQGEYRYESLSKMINDIIDLWLQDEEAMEKLSDYRIKKFSTRY